MKHLQQGSDGLLHFGACCKTLVNPMVFQVSTGMANWTCDWLRRCGWEVMITFRAVPDLDLRYQ
jgi:hypothetical protein